MAGRPDEERYELYLPGWRPWLSVTDKCPRKLVGKRCLAYQARSSVCECQSVGYPLWDHAEMWKAPNGDRVLTLSPYDVPSADLVVLEQSCEPLGLEVVWTKRDSPYGFGAHFVVICEDFARLTPYMNSVDTDERWATHSNWRHMAATVKLYRTEDGTTIATDATDEREFVQAVSSALAEAIDGPDEMADFLPHVIDIACKLRGYKAPSVTEKRVLISGPGVLPETAMIVQANGRGIIHAEATDAATD